MSVCLFVLFIYFSFLSFLYFFFFFFSRYPKRLALDMHTQYLPRHKIHSRLPYLFTSYGDTPSANPSGRLLSKRLPESWQLHSDMMIALACLLFPQPSWESEGFRRGAAPKRPRSANAEHASPGLLSATIIYHNQFWKRGPSGTPWKSARSGARARRTQAS